MLRRAWVLTLLLGVATLATGCLTFQARQPVFVEGAVSVFLRSDSNVIGQTKRKDHEHPAQISNIRLTHILSRLDVRTEVKAGNRREPAIPTELLAPVAQGISQALGKASPDQEVVVMAFRTDHSFGVFDKRYLTSLLAYVRGDQLFLFVDKSDATLDKRQEKKPPEPRTNVRHTRFRLHPGDSMTLIDSQTVAVAWRSPLFSRPTRTKILPSGQVVRKTILMEEAPEASVADPTTPGLPGGLTPTQLRALADLEEARERGEITEGQYQTRRAVILAGS
jgi:hypothetical protein